MSDLVLGFQPIVSRGMEVVQASSLPGTAGVVAVELVQVEFLPHHPQGESH